MSGEDTRVSYTALGGLAGSYGMPVRTLARRPQTACYSSPAGSSLYSYTRSPVGASIKKFSFSFGRSMALRVLEPGLCTLLVDQGRPRTRSHGVPLGGAADRTCLALGNALAGNPPDAPALEITLAGPTLQAEGN